MNYICSKKKKEISVLLSHLYFISAQANGILSNILQETSNCCLLIYIYWRPWQPVQTEPPSQLFLYRHSSPSFILLSPAAQFDGSERPAKDETLHATLARQPQHPPNQLQNHQHLRQKSWTQKILRSSLPSLSPTSTSSGSSCESEGCCVDPSVPLEKQR